MKVTCTLNPPTKRPKPGTKVMAAFRNPDTGLEFQYPMTWNGKNWIAARAREHRGFHTPSGRGVEFLGWIYLM